jgi:hypothetical protein
MSKLGFYCCGRLRDNGGDPKYIKKSFEKLKKGEVIVFKRREHQLSKHDGQLSCWNHDECSSYSY